MSGNDGVGARDTRWPALRNQFDRLKFESAHLCETAHQLRSDAVEECVRSRDDRRRRYDATTGQRQ